MRIVCNKCGHKMNIGELVPHLIAYFTKIMENVQKQSKKENLIES